MEENINIHFVLDASFALAYLLPDEKTPFVDDFFDRYIQVKILFTSTHLVDLPK